MTPIDLSQFEGHTPRPWVIVLGGYKGTFHLTGDAFTDDEDIANAALIKAAPDILAYARSLEATNNSLVDKCAELRAEVERLKDDNGIMDTTLEFAIKRGDDAQSHAAELAGALGDVVKLIGDGQSPKDLGYSKITDWSRDFTYSCTNARAALAKYHEAMNGGDSNEDGDEG